MWPDALRPFADPPDPPGPRWPRRRLRWLLAALAVPVLAIAWLGWRLPVDRALEPLPEPALVLLDAQGRPYARRGAYKAPPVDARELPAHVVDAVLSIEDRRFRRHDGIDLRGIGRALVANAKAGEVVEGGSTISQQLAKDAFLSGERTLRRKAQEALAALWLEARLEKHEILSRYLSSIYFGDGVHGLRGAARHYFDVEPEALDLGQAAVLAGMIHAPSALAPTRNLDAAHERARVVLASMADTGAITQAQARATPLPGVQPGRADLPVGGYFADWASPQAKAAHDRAYGEVPVRTTLDGDLQRLAERVVADALERHGADLGIGQAALVAMRPNGEVVAMVGGRDYAASAYNRATQARRQPGSAFKLFVYRAALEAGMSLDDTVEDSPVRIGEWAPANHDARYRGPMPLRVAFARSSNVAAARLAQRVGTGEIASAAAEWGIEGVPEGDASIALGTHATTLLELTAAYAALAAGAAPVRPHALPARPPPGPRAPLDEHQRRELLELLWGAVEHGTGRQARLRIPTFGKTGTTQGYRDAVFVGMAGNLVAGVWVGNDDNAPMRGVTGGGVPADIWASFMAPALGTTRAATLPPPPEPRVRPRTARGPRNWFERLKARFGGRRR